jgi:hypothetical protein
MANTIAAGATKQMWIPGVQKNLDSMLVAKQISTVNGTNDRVIYNPFHSQIAGSDGAAATAYTIADFETSADSLTVNRRAVAAEHVDNIEELQASFALTQERMNEASAVVAKKIDQFMLNLPVANAGIKLGNSGVEGSTTPWSSSNSVIDDIVNTTYERLAVNNSALEKGVFMVLSPYEVTDIKSFMQSNGFGVADKTIEKGLSYRGTTFSGVDIYVSNNLTHVAVLTMATNPTAGDTVTIAGVTFTFRATLTGAGDLHIGTAVDDTRLNFANALNAPQTAIVEAATTGYTPVSEANQLILRRLQVTAVDAASPNTLTVTARGTFSVSETLTDGTDAWGTVRRYIIGGVNGSMYLALPTGGTTFEKKKVSGKHGVELETSQVYNGTIWTKYVPQIATILVD